MNKIDLAAGGLALCYLVHDGEELLTYRESSRWALGRLPEGVALPAGLREHGWSQRHINIGVGLMGLNWVGAALAGLRSGGRSAWFQNALATWTLHGFGHLGLCLLRRGYVSGAVTAPLVIGHGVWVLRVLREEGVPRRVSAAGMAATLPVLVAAHAGAEVIARLLDRADAACESAGAECPRVGRLARTVRTVRAARTGATPPPATRGAGEMWAVQYHRSGGPEVLRVEEIAAPSLRDGQVLVRTLASGVSRIDALYRRGRLPHGPTFPKQTGFDAIGEVVQGRAGAIRPGDRVAVVLGLEPLRGRGTTVELLAVEPSRCGAFPAGYEPRVEDCALVLGGLTALRAVRDGLRPRRGERVLVVGAGGPVGLAAIQIVRGAGAVVDAVAGSAALEECLGLGADEAYDYRGEEAVQLRASRRYDGMVVAAGRPSDWFTAVRRGGRAALTDGGVWPGSVVRAVRAGVRSIPIAAGHGSGDLRWLARRIAGGDLVPVVGRRYGVGEVGRAHTELGTGPTRGARIIDHRRMP
ncbi:MAG: zinc-binding dehydrogenase [Actinomyces dentalis]